MNKFISKIFGYIANLNFPTKIQNFINKKYVEFFKIDLSEFKNFNEYKNLNELFTRKLIKQREFSKDKFDFISPSDGECLSIGISDKNRAISIKNKSYFLDELLKEDNVKDLMYCNIYLSPRDYHRYHAPADLEIISATYVSANLYSVNKKTLLKVSNLYAKNERVILKTKLFNNKILYLVFVGAINVGKMRFNFDDRIQTNAKNGDFTYEYKNLFVKKGEELGNFELGSTIVIVSDKDSLKYEIKDQDFIKFSQTIAKIL